jgi:nucleotide-binding universal stress UspA family protein
MSQMQAGQRIRVILLATRFTPKCAAAAAVAAELARHFGARVVLMHVAAHRSDGAEARRHLHEIAATMSDLEVEMVVGYGEPAHDILRAARHESTDLIVVGRAHSRGALVPQAMDEILDEAAPCPVLAVAIGETAQDVLRGLPLPPQSERHCLVCARPTGDLVCETCRNRIVADAMDHKRRVEKGA